MAMYSVSVVELQVPRRVQIRLRACAAAMEEHGLAARASYGFCVVVS